ncbi:MAG: FMN-binding protein [Acholeplasmataceae bacterium]|nr:FMN-binding protein [Acholeplasmataceae bacterium]
MMTRENKWLIINAFILILVGVLFLFGYNMYKEQLVVNQYKEYISTVTSLKEEKVEDSIIQKKITLKNGSEVVGYAYVGSDFAEGIPGHNEPSELRIQVIVDKNFVIKKVLIDYSEHTPDFVKYVEQYFEKLPETAIIDYKKVDEVAGASKYSMPIVREILTEATILLTGKEPNPAELPDPYKNIFENYDSYEVDATFTATDKVTKKEIVKDASDVVLGYAYTVTGTVEGIPYHDGPARVTLLVGIDLDGKIIGVETLVSEHTASFYEKHLPYFGDLGGVAIADFETVDSVAGATLSFNLIKELLNAVKAVA